jgi:hypothetical protein
MKKHTIKIFALLALTFLFVSCQKEEIDSTDDISAEQSVTDVENVMDDAGDEALFRLSEDEPGAGCPTITWAQDKGTYPNTVTIDFGESCVGANGRVRSGKIIVEVTGSYYTEGMVRIITPDGFTVNGWTLEGTRTVTNMGLNEQEQMYWTVVVDEAKLTDDEGNFATWQANRVRTLVEGADTEGCSDDVMAITGESSGVSLRGKSFTATIIDPIMKPMSCRWPVSGVREVLVEGHERPRSLDFGNGECDNKATITFPNGQTREIELRR